MEKQTVKFSIEVTRAQLRAALIFAADRDIRYYLNGVCLHVGECGDARLVATDGHRLAIVKLCDQSSATPGEYLMPRDVLKTVKKAGRLDKTPLLLSIDGDAFQIADQADRAILGGARLIDGKFPDYQRVIPDPSTMDGTPGTFNASFLADIQKALIELGDKNGFYSMLQDGAANPRGLVVREDKDFLCVVMGMRGFDTPSAPDVAQFMPLRMPRAVIETAAGGQAFPCDPAQNVDDKRAQAADIEAPAVVAHCGADIAAWIDPDGALQAAGLLMVAHIGDKPKETRPRSIVSTLETATTKHGRPLMLQYRTAGLAPAGAGETFVNEAWGSIVDIDGFVTSGSWYATEDKARAEFERVRMPESAPADAEYLEYLASMQADKLQAAA